MKLKTSYWPAVSRVLFDTDLIATRLVLAFAELMWGIMLFWPGDTFGRPTYHVMAHVMNEEAWALVFLVSAVTQVAIVLLEDYNSRFARYFACWNGLLWSYVVVSMLLSVYPPPAAVGGEIALALSACWIFLRPFILSIGYHRAARAQTDHAAL